MASLTIRPAIQLRRKVAALNATLVLGSVSVIGLIGVAAAAPLLAPFDPNETVVRFNGSAMAAAPYPPGTLGMLLGSDTLRRDVLSRLMYGSRYTLLFCGLAAVFRVLLGIALGMLAGWYQSLGRVVDLLVSVSSAVPSLLFALIPLRLINMRDDLQSSVIGFLIVLSLTGWAEAAIRTRASVQLIRAAPFIESAYAIGRGRLAVLWHHVRPNLRGLLLVEAAYAMGAVLLLVAELGFLGTFVGGAQIESVGNLVVTVDTIYAEWGSMLARGLRDRGAGAWLFLAPMAAFTLAIMSFNLFAEGLRRHLR